MQSIKGYVRGQRLHSPGMRITWGNTYHTRIGLPAAVACEHSPQPKPITPTYCVPGVQPERRYVLYLCKRVKCVSYRVHLFALSR